MFTGFNSDIERDGKTFHVQTEDKGLDNPVVETRVYSGGQVVAAVENSYADLAQSRDYSKDQIQKRMREQHQSLLEDLKNGRLSPDPKVRFRIDAPDLSREHLIQEYVEDWIDTTATVQTVHRILEADIDGVLQKDNESLRTRRAKKKLR